MAQDLAVSIVGILVEKAVDPIVGAVGRQCRYVFCYKGNIKTLHTELQKLNTRRDGVQQCINEAAWNSEAPNPSVTEWLKSVGDINSQAKEVDDGTSIVDKGCLNGWCPNLKRRYLLSRKATKLTVDICGLYKDGDRMPVKSTHSATPVGIVQPAESSISHKVDGYEGFATRRATMNEVMDALKADKINLIGISGMGGVGKTTLVENVIKKVRAESLFKEVTLAVVSQKPDLDKIQSKIAEQLGLKLNESSSVARVKRLRERLEKSGNALVVLDDIWEGINLHEVGIPAGNGCKVVFTTRNERVCIEMKVQKHIKVKVLSNQEALSLFREVAGDCVENVDLCDIAKEVAMECGGLPIAVVTLAKALSERERSKWEDTLLQLRKSSVPDEKVESSIMLSYQFLESRRPNPQRLLLLCSLFEEDANISIELLVKYSLGLELFADVETLEETRNRVHSLLNDLKSCNLLLQADGYADVCVKLHDVVRDVCLLIASKPPHSYKVKHDIKVKHWPDHDGHKADHTAIALKSSAMNELPGGLDYPNLRLLQLQLESENISIAGEFFQGMRGLKVFNFVGNYRACRSQREVTLPQTLGLLTNLQALSLENCILGGDISSIGCLKGLKILSFSESNLRVKFPSEEVGELKNLKMLDLRFDDSSRSLMIEACVFSGLDQLEVLYLGKYVFSNSIKELNSLCCLTTLQIMVSKSRILLELEQPFFEKLKRFDIYIDSKRGYSCGEYGIIENRIGQWYGDLSWVSHTKLRSLVTRIQSFRLKLLDEDRFMLDERESVFSALSNLESLVIDNMKNLREMSPDSKIPQGSFHRLQKLFLRDLPALKHLWRGPAQPPSLFNLRDVIITNCDSIESLFSPDLAKCMLKLEDLDISWCKRLKGVVVSNQGKQGFEIIQFPKLKSIMLAALPNFESFYPEAGNEDLDGERGTIHTLFNEWVRFPSLKEISIYDAEIGEPIVGYQMQDRLANTLRKINVSQCNQLRNFVDSTMLENLEEVNIHECDSMKVVFDLEGLKVGEEDSPFVFDKLASIELVVLKKLAHVWKMVPDSIQGFRNVTTLVVEGCNELRYIMSYSVAKMLVNLQVLELRQCDKIVGVIQGEDEEECSGEAKSNGCILFPQLQKLELKDLQNLTSFCSSKCSLEFPLLEKVFIWRCPDMKRFCGGEVKAPVLKEPVEDPFGNEWFCWEGNLNNRVNRGKSKYSLEFPLLDYVEIWRCPDMKKFCGGEVKAPVLKEPVEDADGDEWFWNGNLNNGNNRAKRKIEAKDERKSEMTSLKDVVEDENDQVDEHEAKGDESDDNKDHDADNNDNNK